MSDDRAWELWTAANGFTVTGHKAERCWSHSDGYGYVTLRFVWGRNDSKADTVLIGSGYPRHEGLNVAACSISEAQELTDFMERNRYQRRGDLDGGLAC